MRRVDGVGGAFGLQGGELRAEATPSLARALPHVEFLSRKGCYLRSLGQVVLHTFLGFCQHIFGHLSRVLCHHRRELGWRKEESEGEQRVARAAGASGTVLGPARTYVTLVHLGDFLALFFD